MYIRSSAEFMDVLTTVLKASQNKNVSSCRLKAVAEKCETYNILVRVEF